MATSSRDFIVLTGIAIVAAQSHVHGYIDPGSTSMLLQGIIGGVAAVLVITRSYWARTMERLRRPAVPAPPAEGTAQDDGGLPPTTPGA